MDDDSARRNLFENFLSVSRDARAEDVKARTLIGDRLGVQAAVVRDPKRAYRIPLQDTSHGPILRARINLTRGLRLLVDTGASGITLVKRGCGIKLGLDYLPDAAVMGFGSGARSRANDAGREFRVGRSDDLKSCG